MNTRQKFKYFFFNLIRPFFVKDIDHNEDYDCIICGEPVLRRVMQCSEKCYKESQRLGIC